MTWGGGDAGVLGVAAVKDTAHPAHECRNLLPRRGFPSGASTTMLYRYAGDAKPGDTNGQRVTAFGAAWFAVSGAGQVVSRPASKPGGGSIY